MKVRRILVCGYYGFANTGDEAILAALIEDLRATNPGAGIVVMAGSPQTVIGHYGVEAFHWQDVVRLVDEAKRVDLMVLGGGGLFQDYQGVEPEQILTSRHGTIGYYTGFALLAGMTSKPLVIYAVGVGPLATDAGRRYTRLAFGRASAATVRDQASLDLLAEIGADASRVQVTADPVWTLEPASPAVADQILEREGVEPLGTTIIGVAVRPWGTGTWIGELAAALDRLVDERGARVLFVPFQDSPLPHENDAQAALDVARGMERIDRTAIIRGAYTPVERMAILGSCDLVIGMRLHSVIFAANGGVSLVALSYDAKVREAMAQLGIRGQALDLATLSADAVVEAASRAVAPEAEVVSRLRVRAVRNRSVLVKLPPPPPPDEATVAAYNELSVVRVHDQARLESELSKLRKQQRMLTEERLALKEQLHVFGEERRTLELQLRQLIMSRSWAVTRPLRFLGRLARAPRDTSLDLARRIFHGLPNNRLKSTSRRIASGVLGWQQGRGVSTPIMRTPVRRRLNTWAAFEAVVLSERENYKGIFIQSLGIPWDVPLYQRPQHIAVALGRLGYLVIYRTRSDYESRDMQAAEEIAENVWLSGFEEVSTIQGAVTSYYSTGFWHSVDDYVTSRKQGPVVYEYIDHIDPAISGTENVEKLKELRDFAFADGVDYIVASARALAEEARNSAGPERVIFAPNGVDFEHYRAARQSVGGVSIPRVLRSFLKKYPRVVGYFGALAPWIWYSMLHDLVALRPDLGFVFIGPDYLDASKQLPRAANLLWTGPVDYKNLPAFASHFDVAIIPFAPGDIAETTSPLKLFEYFALGKPVVVTADMKECVVYEEVLAARSAREFSAQIDDALRQIGEAGFEDRMLKLARQNDWTARAEAMTVAFPG